MFLAWLISHVTLFFSNNELASADVSAAEHLDWILFGFELNPEDLDPKQSPFGNEHFLVLVNNAVPKYHNYL